MYFIYSRSFSCFSLTKFLNCTIKLKATAIKKNVEPKRSTTSNEKENLICYKIQKEKKAKNNELHRRVNKKEVPPKYIYNKIEF